MFSGIVQSLGTIISISEAREIVTLEVQTTKDFTKDLKVGDSVAVDGVCLTLTKSKSDRIFFDAVPETLNKTLIKSYTKGTKVNLEPSLRFNDSVGGHIMSGHIHTTGHINQVEIHGDAKDIVIDAGANWGRFLFEKGYIGINGCSITLGEITEGRFIVHLIPETLRATNLDNLVYGNQVNLEFDQNTITIVETTERILRDQAK
ncbi:riboflavin synthase subunit alpha [Gammaproteobacteria bacterium]|nr:riboflavin synthase subunit alpha [Gammaproteobacteria bacterium]